MTRNALLEKAGLQNMVVEGMRYHTPLPQELEQCYCYVTDAGHSIIVTLPSLPGDPENNLVPACVKTVLRRGYTVKDGYVWCDIPYSKQFGLLVDDEDYEFEDAKDSRDTGIISVVNEGALIRTTNYWTSIYAKTGKCFFSVNAGCIRLLLSGREDPSLDDALAAARYVIVTRGKYHAQEGFEVLFEDGSDEPFVILTLANQWDRLLPRTEAGRTAIAFHVYRNGALVRKMEARFRMAPELPCLRPWE